jgi:hypothetical protein
MLARREVGGVPFLAILQKNVKMQTFISLPSSASDSNYDRTNIQTDDHPMHRPRKDRRSFQRAALVSSQRRHAAKNHCAMFLFRLILIVQVMAAVQPLSAFRLPYLNSVVDTWTICDMSIGV